MLEAQVISIFQDETAKQRGQHMHRSTLQVLQIRASGRYRLGIDKQTLERGDMK